MEGKVEGRVEGAKGEESECGEGWGRESEYL